METTIGTHTEEIVDTPFGADVGDEYVGARDKESCAKLAEEFGVSPKLVEAIADAFRFLVENIQDEISADLKEIWKRVD